jgi:hypothetical protein
MPRLTKFIGTLVISSVVLIGPAAPTVHADASTHSTVQTRSASWPRCELLDKRTKKLRTFDRAAAAGLSAGKSTLACGYQGWDGERGWGFRHIRHRHEGDWTRITHMVGGTWTNVADWSIAQALKRPASVSYEKDNDTYLYETAIYIYDQRGTLRHSFYVRVIVGGKTNNIITAFPRTR